MHNEDPISKGTSATPSPRALQALNKSVLTGSLILALLALRLKMKLISCAEHDGLILHVRPAVGDDDFANS